MAGVRFVRMISRSLLMLAAITGGALMAIGATAQPSGKAAADGFAARIVLDGPIGPAAAEYFGKALANATGDGATVVVLQIDTPGGLAESMRQIVSAILASRMPVIGYVAPDGARAASAGTYILYACQLAAMAPATHLGAATPVSIGGSTPMPLPKPPATPAPSSGSSPGKVPPAGPAAKPAAAPEAGGGDAEAHKVLNDAIAYIRSLAELRHRNADWAEQAVRGAATLTADDAVKEHVADFIATDVADVLRQADGRQVTLGTDVVTLHTANLAVRDYAPGWRTSFLGIITNPTIAYLLLLAGIYGLVLEALHPGALFPGVAGAIALLIGLYALQLLPVNYAGLALMALGVALLLAEAFVPAYGTLGAGGIIAFVIGSIMLFDTGVPGYALNVGVIGGIAASGIGLLAVILWLVVRARRAHVVSGDRYMLDARGELLAPLEAGRDGEAMIFGERWRVRSDSPLPAGTPVRVVRRDGLLLWVERA